MLAFISYPPIPIFEVGPLRLSLHGLFAALGFVAGAWIASREIRKRGFDVAGIQDVEKIQHVLTIWSLSHSPILPVLDSALVAGSL